MSSNSSSFWKRSDTTNTQSNDQNPSPKKATGVPPWLKGTTVLVASTTVMSRADALATGRGRSDIAASQERALSRAQGDFDPSTSNPAKGLQERQRSSLHPDTLIVTETKPPDKEQMMKPSLAHIEGEDLDITAVDDFMQLAGHHPQKFKRALEILYPKEVQDGGSKLEAQSGERVQRRSDSQGHQRDTLKEKQDVHAVKQQDGALSAIKMDDVVQFVLEHPKRSLELLSHHPEIVKVALDAIRTDHEVQKLYQSIHQKMKRQDDIQQILDTINGRLDTVTSQIEQNTNDIKDLKHPSNAGFYALTGAASVLAVCFAIKVGIDIKIQKITDNNLRQLATNAGIQLT